MNRSFAGLQIFGECVQLILMQIQLGLASCMILFLSTQLQDLLVNSTELLTSVFDTLPFYRDFVYCC